MAENSWKLEGRQESRAGAEWSGAPSTQHATIGPSVVIRGEISGTEPLFVDGTVEGSISIPGHRVTIGGTSQIRAEIRAHDVVVAGSVEGNIHCADLLDIRTGSTIQGHLIAQRIRIDDGAFLKGSVEVHSNQRSSEANLQLNGEDVVAVKPAAGAESVDPAETFKTTLREAAAAVSVAGGQSARRVSGSRTLVEPAR